MNPFTIFVIGWFVFLVAGWLGAISKGEGTDGVWAGWILVSLIIGMLSTCTG